MKQREGAKASNSAAFRLRVLRVLPADLLFGSVLLIFAAARIRAAVRLARARQRIVLARVLNGRRMFPVERNPRSVLMVRGFGPQRHLMLPRIPVCSALRARRAHARVEVGPRK